MSEFIIEVSEWVIDANGNHPFGKGEEIVRCRDCKFFNAFHGLCHRPVLIVDGITNTRWVDGTDETEPICATSATPDGFCAWGERKCELELIEEGIEYAKATYPNTMRLLEDE